MSSQENYNNIFRTVTICVDEYKNQIPCGRIYDLHQDKGICFQGTIGLLQSIDTVLEEMNSPQSFTGKRVLWSEDRKEPEAITDGIRGGKTATFTLRILFRKNASWQGVVTWIEGRAEESFRSVLELLLLMDSAMNSPPVTAKEM